MDVDALRERIAELDAAVAARRRARDDLAAETTKPRRAGLVLGALFVVALVGAFGLTRQTLTARVRPHDSSWQHGELESLRAATRACAAEEQELKERIDRCEARKGTP